MSGIVVVSADVETTGAVPGLYSMISWAGVALDAEGVPLEGAPPFSVNLAELPEATRDADTMTWWAQWPTQWAESTKEPLAPQKAMSLLDAWCKQLPGRPVFLAWPAGFDWGFTNYYCWRYLGRNPFGYSPLCLKSYGAGLLRDTAAMLTTREESVWPREWVSTPEVPHIALNDATEQGAVFRRMRAWANAHPSRPLSAESPSLGGPA